MMHTLFFESRISYILQAVPLAVLAGLVFLLRHRKARWDLPMAARLLFVSYFAAYLGIVMVPAGFWNAVYYPLFYGMSSGISLEFFQFHFNLEPTLLLMALGLHTMGSWGLFMMAANALLLVPFGFLHPLAYPGKRTLKTGMLTIVVLECLQPIAARSFDVDDILMNAAGLLVGYGLCRLLNRT